MSKTSVNLITVVFINSITNTESPRSYKFKMGSSIVKDLNLKEGDIIESLDYDNPMKIKYISCDFEDNPKKLSATFGFNVKTLVVDKVNNKKRKTIMKKTKFTDKLKKQFKPSKVEGLKLTLEGTIAVPVNGEYVGINDQNELVSYPDNLVLDFPVYSIYRKFSDIKVGDIIRVKNSYGKVLRKNKNGSLQCLTYSGTTSNKREIKDFILGQASIETIINLAKGLNFKGGEETNNPLGINPMLLLMSEEDTNMKDILMMQMMQGNNFNPLMLMMLDKDEEDEDGNSLMEMLMYSQLLNNNNNPFNI